jgi:hypothetical protein
MAGNPPATGLIFELNSLPQHCDRRPDPRALKEINDVLIQHAGAA